MKKILISLGMAILLLSNCFAVSAASRVDLEIVESYPSLKELYSDYFEIGVCINPQTIGDERYAALIAKQFSSATCENDMKPDAIMSKFSSQNNVEDGGTRIVLNMKAVKPELNFARDHGMKMRGHTLIWHSQTPDWIFHENFDVRKPLASRELMLTRVDNYMADIFSWAEENYPGLFYAWDIVNEAMGDDAVMRESLWYKTIGEDYIEQVFALARKHAPEGIALFYNDYNAYQTEKQKAIIEMLRPVAEAGNLDGVGMQGHLYTGEEPKHFANCAKRYAEELGVMIHITEIDVTQPKDGEDIQGFYYGNLFKELALAKQAGVPIESVSIWGLADNLSWKANEKPLLFKVDLTPKQAFDQIVKRAEELQK